nr:putative mitochondrial protein [Ipomoea batatas]
MEFPTFSGHEDPLIWLHHCELYFHTAHTPVHAQVELAAFNMTGKAQLWYYQILRGERRMTWGIFKDYCKLRFGPSHNTNPLGDLINVKQRARHIDEYVSDFQLLLARADSVRIDQQVDLFTTGLDELLRIDVERKQEERKSKGLCFNCDETLSRGHQCKNLFCVLGINEEEDSDGTTIEDLEVAEISLHAITGVSTWEMMKLRVLIEGTPLLALVDTGSTHNFINTSTASHGSSAGNKGRGGKWGFSVKHWPLDIPHALAVVSSLLPASNKDILNVLLSEFDLLFQEVSTLPPSRSCDHQIILSAGSDLVAVHPYRYPQVLKDEIEKQCADMLEQGIIRPSKSPFLLRYFW